MAIDWLPSRKIDHPMASMKKAREMVAALPRGDSVRALEDAASLLDSINCEPGFKLDYRMELLDLIDGGAKVHWHAVAPEYLDAPRLQKLYENRLWRAFFGYWRMLGDAYASCLKQYQSSDTVGGIEKELPRIVGRVLRSLTVQIKWRLLRYEIVEDRIWEGVGSTYLFAESRGFARKQAAIYPGKHGESSAQEELLKALLLMMSSPDALTPVNLQIAERVVAHLAKLGSVEATHSAGGGFYFDLAMHIAPARVHKGMRAGSMTRFFGPGAGRKALIDIAQVINEKGSVPEELNLGGNFGTQAVTRVLSHMGRCWAVTPPERRSPRIGLVTRLTVVPGFYEAVAWIASSATSDSLEFAAPVTSESWVVSNASDGGYCATVPSRRADWLRVGALVGLRAEGQLMSRAGIVRRTNRDKDGQWRVGIEVLSKATVPVRFTKASGEKVAVPAGDINNALLLNSKPDAKGQVDLLLTAGSYIAGKPAHMFVRGKGIVISPVSVVEEGEDFDLARFKVVKPL